MHSLWYAVAALYISTHFVLVQRRVPYPLIDEIFHVPQAQAYCQEKFHVWDNKITTLPGSYIYSYSLLKPFLYSFHQKTCSIHGLRITNLAALFGIFFLCQVHQREQPNCSSHSHKPASDNVLSSLLHGRTFNTISTIGIRSF